MTDTNQTNSPRIIIFMEGGLIHYMKSNVPIQIRVVDYDDEGVPAEDLIEVEGDPAYCSDRSIDAGSDDVSPEYVDTLFHTIDDHAAVSDAANPPLHKYRVTKTLRLVYECEAASEDDAETACIEAAENDMALGDCQYDVEELT